MKRAIRRVSLVAVFAALVPVAVQAQAIYAGAGPLIPVGDFGDAADAGWLAAGGVVFPLGGPLGIGAEGLYGSAIGVDSGPSTDIWGILGTVGLIFGDEGSVRPYIFGGAGVIGADVDTDSPGVDGSDSSFGYEATAGLDLPVGDRIGIFVEGRYIGTSDLNMLAALGGVGVRVGGG